MSKDTSKILKNTAGNEVDTTVQVRDDLPILDKLVIKLDSTWKGVFDFIMMITSCYNIFGNAYYAAFGAP